MDPLSLSRPTAPQPGRNGEIEPSHGYQYRRPRSQRTHNLTDKITVKPPYIEKLNNGSPASPSHDFRGLALITRYLVPGKYQGGIGLAVFFKRKQRGEGSIRGFGGVFLGVFWVVPVALGNHTVRFYCCVYCPHTCILPCLPCLPCMYMS